MEILFFRLANRIAAISTKYIRIVLHEKETVPFLPVTAYVPEMIVNQGRAVGVIDLHRLFGIRPKGGSERDIIVMNFNDKEFGLSVRRIIMTRRIPKRCIRKAGSGYFIPDTFVGYECSVGSKAYPIVSMRKILESGEIKYLWSKENAVG